MSDHFTPAEILAMRFGEHYKTLEPIFRQSTPMNMRWLSLPERDLLIAICERLIADFALHLTEPCPRCWGCGKIANDSDGTPWLVWLDLPLGSAVAVVAGLIKPLPCPTCNGTGRIPAEEQSHDRP